jgi:hypothetical protein
MDAYYHCKCCAFGRRIQLINVQASGYLTGTDYLRRDPRNMSHGTGLPSGAITPKLGPNHRGHTRIGGYHQALVLHGPSILQSGVLRGSLLLRQG